MGNCREVEEYVDAWVSGQTDVYTDRQMDDLMGKYTD